MPEEFLDLRSDTVTQPTDAMRQAMLTCEVGDDVVGEDPTINEIEAYTAELLGKEAGLFVPSGTFANQCAILTHTKPADEVVLAENCHIVEHEAGAASLFSGVSLRCVPPSNGTYMVLDDVLPRLRTSTVQDIHYPDTGLICLEQATASGDVYPLEVMQAIAATAGKYSIPIHIDGARIFNAAVALGVEATDIAQCGDSISLCLSKGLSAPVGSLLVGSKDFIHKARKNRKRMGGGMRQAGFLAAAGLIALKEMRLRLHVDHANTKLLAMLLDASPKVNVLQEPVINMVFARLAGVEREEMAIVEDLHSQGIKVYPPEYGTWRFVCHRGVTEEDVRRFALTFLGTL